MALTAGSIAFVGFNADGNDDIAFVALETITAGTVIHFSDKEWTGTAFNTGEGGWSWTSPGTDIDAGTIITINQVSGTITASHGTVTGGSGLGSSGEIVYAFLGTDVNTPTTFLAAIATDTFALEGGTLTGTGLTAGVNAISFGNQHDVFVYAGARSGEADFPDYLALINDTTNWQTQDGANDQSNDGTPPDLPFATTAFTTPAPDTAAPFLASSNPADNATHISAGANIVWRNDDGTILAWLMDEAGSFTSREFAARPESTWEVESSDDFNGDNIADLLWRNTADGQVVTWLMDPNGGFTSGGIGSPEASWHVLNDPASPV